MAGPVQFVSHARTPEQLKAELLSDLQRRLQNLDDYDRIIARSITEKSRIARAKNELEAMFRYWSEVQIIRPRKTNSKRDEVHE